MDHQRLSYCDLDNLTAMDLYTSALSAYNTRISNYVRTYYANIREAVNEGRFNITLAFDCATDMRKTLLTTVIEHLTKKMSGVVFTPSADLDSFVADWSQQQKMHESKTYTVLRYIREFSKAAPTDEVSEKPWSVTSLKDLDFSTIKSIPERYDAPFDIFWPSVKVTLKDIGVVSEEPAPYSYFT